MARQDVRDRLPRAQLRVQRVDRRARDAEGVRHAFALHHQHPAIAALSLAISCSSKFSQCARERWIQSAFAPMTWVIFLMNEIQ
jgi:hypothetical protein